MRTTRSKTSLKLAWMLLAGAWAATLTQGGRVTEFFRDPLRRRDFMRFGFQQGACEGQQCWEALVTLVALRLWAPALQAQRFAIRVKGDSVVTLVLAGKLKAKGSGTNRIARDMALDTGAQLYVPRLLEHTPGVANHVPDVLSRLTEPGGPRELPAACRGAVERRVPPRTAHYYLADHARSRKRD